MDTIAKTLSSGFGHPPLEAIPLDKPVSIDELPTPALVVDLDIFETNLKLMQSWVNDQGMALRGHAKMHKCPVIAHRQIESGARGICVATVSEAEVMSKAGISNILITSPLMTTDKIERVASLAERSAAVSIVIDNLEGAILLDNTLSSKGVNMDVLIDLDPGLGRTGVASGLPALELAKQVMDQCRSLRFSGLQMYAGHCMHIEGYEARKEKYRRSLSGGFETLELFEKENIAVPVFSGGGTGSFNLEPEIGLINELQAGSYLFMDVEYRQIGDVSGDVFDVFEPSLFVLLTAISQPQRKMITVDGGYKSFASDTVVPEFRDIEGLVYHWGGDEHGIVLLNNPSREVKPGDRLALITSHCDPTVNLYDYCFPFRDGYVEEIWPISARGCSQ